MSSRLTLLLVVLFATSCRNTETATRTNSRTFEVRGVVKEVRMAERTAIIKHEAITNYMAAMTMPFKVKLERELTGLQPGDEIDFRLSVTQDESWIDRIRKTGKKILLDPLSTSTTNSVPSVTATHPLLDFKFTNEFGRPVSFNDFRGRAVAYTFFFTRCPIPEFCPRLSKNFAEATQKLLARPDAPTNWHFLSFTFDPKFDTPEVLRAYGKIYNYNSNHWSFITGPKDKLAELAAASDVKYDPDGALFNHNFRTLVIDAAGNLQMSFPISGDLSDHIVTEILKAAAVTNR